VRKTSAKIFWKLEIKSIKVPSEKFLNKICRKFKNPHKKLPIEQIKPYLKCPTNILLWIFILPNQIPHKIKPGIWVKLLSRVKASKMRPKKKPIINPFIEPFIIDHGNNQNKGQYGWIPNKPSQFGCHKKIIGIKIKLINDNFFFKNLFIKFLLINLDPIYCLRFCQKWYFGCSFCSKWLLNGLNNTNWDIWRKYCTCRRRWHKISHLYISIFWIKY